MFYLRSENNANRKDNFNSSIYLQKPNILLGIKKSI